MSGEWSGERILGRSGIRGARSTGKVRDPVQEEVIVVGLKDGMDGILGVPGERSVGLVS